MDNKSMLITALVAVVVGIAAFFGGVSYQKSQALANGRAFPGMNNGAEGFGRNAQGQGEGMMNRAGTQNRRLGANGGAAIGSILTIDEQSITVKLQDGSSKIVNLTDSVTIRKSQDATKAELKTGETVAAFGPTNADGSMTAVSIELNPVNRGMMRGLSGTPTK